MVAVESSNRYLLLLACSQRKSFQPGLLPAIERYDGVNYRVLKKAKRDGACPKHLDILIISAMYGLIADTTFIEYYDQRMTPRRARELRPDVTNRLEQYISSNVYTSTFVNLGKDYQVAIDSASVLFQQTRNLQVASGGIGTRMSQMKSWLLSNS